MEYWEGVRSKEGKIYHQDTKTQRKAIEIRPVQVSKCVDAVVFSIYLILVS
jgi:hypothetical protein